MKSRKTRVREDEYNKIKAALNWGDSDLRTVAFRFSRNEKTVRQIRDTDGYLEYQIEYQGFIPATPDAPIIPVNIDRVLITSLQHKVEDLESRVEKLEGQMSAINYIERHRGK